MHTLLFNTFPSISTGTTSTVTNLPRHESRMSISGVGALVPQIKATGRLERLENPSIILKMASPQNPLPSFDQLPLHEGDPPNSAWGLWGRGPESALGSLNYLTNELVLKTIKEEAMTGERVGLKSVCLTRIQ